MSKTNVLNEDMFKLVDYSKGNVICNGTSCSIFNSGEKPYRAKIPPGLYLFEVWGASGGDKSGPEGYGDAYGGKGGYTSGYVIHTEKEIYLFIGKQGESENSIGKGGWNGGGTSMHVNFVDSNFYGGAGGGGSTDISLVLGTEYIEKRSIESLKSRIIVGAGGGGAWASTHNQEDYHFINDGGYGGGEIGHGAGYGYTRICNRDECSETLNTLEGKYKSSVSGATQTSSGDSILTQLNTGGGGGGGWFGGVGGAGGVNHYGTGGSGGNSYAHTNSNKNDLSSLGRKYLVVDSLLLSGNSELIPNPYEGLSQEQFDFKNGAIRINFVSWIDPKICSFDLKSYSNFIVVTPLLYILLSI